MIWNRSQVAFDASLALLLGQVGCGSEAPSAPPLAAPGEGNASALGGAGSAGTAGAANVAGTGGASPCHARPGLLACDDFESASLGVVPGGAWSAAIIGNGTVAVDDSVPAHSGGQGLRACLHAPRSPTCSPRRARAMRCASVNRTAC